MNNSNTITLEVEKFRNSVKKLSNDISSVGADWNDEKYQKLASLVGQVAYDSKCVMESAESFSSDVKKFQSLCKSSH